MAVEMIGVGVITCYDGEAATMVVFCDEGAPDF